MERLTIPTWAEMRREEINRLASLLEDLANTFELPCVLDPDGQGADLGIPYGSKTISSGYSFAPTEDSYEYVAALGEVAIPELPVISSRTMASDPIRGITERITPEGKFVVFGSRDGLESLPDVEIQRGFMDDVARVTEAYDQFIRIVYED